MGNETAQQCSFGGDTYQPRPGNVQRVQAGIPSCRIDEVRRPFGQRRDQGRRQLVFLPISHGDFVNHVVAVFAAQHGQEIQPALAVGAGKISEELVAHLSAIAVLALVPGTGVVHLNVAGAGQSRRQ